MESFDKSIWNVLCKQNWQVFLSQIVANKSVFKKCFKEISFASGNANIARISQCLQTNDLIFEVLFIPSVFWACVEQKMFIQFHNAGRYLQQEKSAGFVWSSLTQCHDLLLSGMRKCLLSFLSHSWSPLTSCVLPVVTAYDGGVSVLMTESLGTWLSGQCPGFSQSFPLCLLEHVCGERPNVYPFPKPSLCNFAVRKTQSSFFS